MVRTTIIGVLLAALAAVDARAAPLSLAAREWQQHALLSWEASPALPFVVEADPKSPGKPATTVLGWLPYWQFGNVTLHLDRLTTIAYFGASLDADGTLSSLHHWGSTQMADLIAAAHAADVRVVLTIVDFDAASIHANLATPAARTKAIDAIVAAVTAGGGDGADVDFEGVAGGDRDRLTAFIAELKGSMDAALGPSNVTLATPAVDWSNAFDVAGLAAASDGLAIMGYDYYYPGGPPGPGSPLESSDTWGQYSLARTLSDYLSSGGPASAPRLFLGLPLYGDDWPTVDATIPGKATAKASSVLFAACATGAAAHGGWSWDGASQTPYYLYASPSWHQVWCQNDESILARLVLAAQGGLGGVAFWALGYEGESAGIWDHVGEVFGASPPDAGPEPVAEVAPDDPAPDVPADVPSEAGGDVPGDATAPADAFDGAAEDLTGVAPDPNLLEPGAHDVAAGTEPAPGHPSGCGASGRAGPLPWVGILGLAFASWLAARVRRRASR